MSTITNEQFSAALADLTDKLAREEITEAQFAAQLQPFLDDWIGVSASNQVLAARVVQLLANVQGLIVFEGSTPPAETGAVGAIAFLPATGKFYGPKPAADDWGDPSIDLTGPPGTAATIAVGTVTTVNPNEPADVTNSGTTNAAVFDFDIPKGDKGDTGDAGTIAVGTVNTVPPGDPATVTNSGTANAAVFDFEIPQGIQGIQGIQGETGAAATIAVGTVSTVAPNDPATVTNSGTSGAAVFDFEIPQGIQGIQGIQGVKGDQGDPGLVWQGEWDSATTYDEDDGVSYLGSSYIALRETLDDAPDASPLDWDLIAAKGQDGDGAGSVTSVAVTGSGGITSTGGPITDSGTISLTINDDALTIAKTDGLQAALDAKADLDDGKVPLAQLPDGIGGGETLITANTTLTDANAPSGQLIRVKATGATGDRITLTIPDDRPQGWRRVILVSDGTAALALGNNTLTIDGEALAGGDTAIIGAGKRCTILADTAGNLVRY